MGDARGSRISRRGLLLGGTGVAVAGGAALAGIESEVLPGRAWLYHRLGRDGGEGVVPDVTVGAFETGVFRSGSRGRDVGWAISRPPGVSGVLPVVIALHGRRQDHTSAFRSDRLGLDRFLAAAVADGVAPFAIASVDGGESYWHDRADGDRAGTMVTDEFLPLLEDHDLDTSRIGLIGWSMGGFGVLRLAALLGGHRVPAVAAMSPALWRDFDDTAPGAYDDRADFDATTVMGRQRDLDGIAVRVDCGEGDPFYAASKEYVEGFVQRPAGAFALGDHDSGYWRRIAPSVLSFLGEAFA
ncbi:alpha/beta hydrolase-fold protein [Nocardioides sp. WS12]|uniref:alpha/beta hydrolase n=1 Tax=Nocardioides sp. WS12 TaxID=2486272 RepID=UPI0015F9A788|nr:alpha/beta hydrolase-fold protein [Nocardioides sp. WS12]